MENRREERQLKFGVEIEVVTKKHAQDIIQALRDNGIEAVQTRYGSKVNPTAWKVQPDGSIKGWEIVSPPLTNLEELEKVIHILRKVVKVRCNKTTGLHVHHDVNDLTVSQLKNVYELYNKYETTVLKTIIDPKRFGNRYCYTLKNYMNYLNDVETIEQFKNAMPTRYMSVNSQSYIKYGTLEFRQHQGTIHYDEIEAWVKLTHKLIETAAMMTELKPIESITKEEQLQEMLKELNAEDTAKRWTKAQKYIEKHLAV